MRFKQFMEMRDRAFEYMQSLVPNWPPYVIQDFIYKGWKNRLQGLPNWLQNFAKHNGFQSPQQMNWQQQVLNVTFDMFDENTKELLKHRMGGGVLDGAKDDLARHGTQAKIVAAAPSKEPIIVVKHPQGYRLEEGWHRTVQSLKNWPQGYQQVAWVLNAPRSYEWDTDIWS